MEKNSNLVDLEKCWKRIFTAKIGVDTAENKPNVEVWSDGVTCTSYFKPSLHIFVDVEGVDLHFVDGGQDLSFIDDPAALVRPGREQLRQVLGDDDLRLVNPPGDSLQRGAEVHVRREVA